MTAPWMLCGVCFVWRVCGGVSLRAGKDLGCVTVVTADHCMWSQIGLVRVEILIFLHACSDSHSVWCLLPSAHPSPLWWYMLAARATMTMLMWRMTSSRRCPCGGRQQSRCMAAADSSATAEQQTGTIYGERRGGGRREAGREGEMQRTGWFCGHGRCVGECLTAHACVRPWCQALKAALKAASGAPVGLAAATQPISHIIWYA